jgi:hypothetical protein
MVQQARSNRIKADLVHLEKLSPSVHKALVSMQRDISELYEELHPIEAIVGEYAIAVSDRPDLPATFSYSFGPYSVNFQWTSVSTALFYELRVGGSDWDTATFVVRTPSLGASVDPLAIGSYTYRLKTITSAGIYSEFSTDLAVSVVGPAAPSLASQVIDNNVLLWWTNPSSEFWIDHYILSVDSVDFSQTTALFASRFEMLSGTYTYGIRAVDTYGNEGVETTVTLFVNQPPDFTLYNSYTMDGTATMTNCFFEDPYFYGAVDLTDTPAIRSGTYATPADQVTAGYAVVYQPNLLTATIEQKFDAGTILNALIITTSWIEEIIPTATDLDISVEMNISDDDVVWSGWTSGASQYFDHFRYFKIRVSFTADNADDFVKLSEIKSVLSVKREVDSNTIFCDSTDATGTEVDMPGDVSLGHGSKTFKDIDSITGEALTTEPATVVIDFVDIPNPTSFSIYVFDAAGRRIDANVSWKVRGAV